MTGPNTFQPIRPPATSDLVRQQIEDHIRKGVLRPGQRLPAERDLARMLAVSRPVVRDALKALEQQGIVHRNYGGGTFVTNALGSDFVDPLVSLLGQSVAAAQDYLEYRQELEGAAAAYAASRATGPDREILELAFGEMLRVHEVGDPELEAAVDIRFHMAIIEASHNLVFSTLSRAMYGLLWQGITDSRRKICYVPTVRDDLLVQHRRIKDAILAGQPAAARDAMVDHLSYVRTCFDEYAALQRREAAATSRLNSLLGELGSDAAEGLDRARVVKSMTQSASRR